MEVNITCYTLESTYFSRNKIISKYNNVVQFWNTVIQQFFLAQQIQIIAYLRFFILTNYGMHEQYWLHRCNVKIHI